MKFTREIEALGLAIQILADDCRQDEDCDHCLLRGLLAEIEGGK